MPRKKRILSSTNIYHIIWRGVSKQNIFIEDYDYKKFLWLLADCKKAFNLEIYSYCLMSNHVHLLIKSDKISEAMGRLGSSYAQWFNTKYERNGHLFQDRFLSEPVEDDRYFVTVIRYIHQNPLKAGLTTTIDEYKWSSYKAYIIPNELVETKFLLEIIGKNKFVEFNNMITDDKCLDIREIPKKITDEQAAKLIMKYINSNSIYDIHELNDKRKAAVLKMLQKNGVALRQIERLTGIRVYAINQLLKN